MSMQGLFPQYISSDVWVNEVYFVYSCGNFSRSYTQTGSRGDLAEELEEFLSGLDTPRIIDEEEKEYAHALIIAQYSGGRERCPQFEICFSHEDEEGAAWFEVRRRTKIRYPDLRGGSPVLHPGLGGVEAYYRLHNGRVSTHEVSTSPGKQKYNPYWDNAS